MATPSTEHLRLTSLHHDSDHESDGSVSDFGDSDTGYRGVRTNKSLEPEQAQHSQPEDNASSKKPGLGQEIRRYPKVTLYILGVATAALLSGYDDVIVSTVPSVTQFKKDFGEQYGSDQNEYIIPSVWLSLWSALGSLGQIFGALASGPWQDHSGRRWPLAVGSIISAVAIAVTYTSNLPDDISTRRGVFLVGEMVQRFATGTATATASTYISETVPTSLRGSAMALLPTFILVGQLAGALVIFGSSGGDAESSYLIAINSMWPFSAVPFLAALLIPESPSYLLRKGRLVDARAALGKLYPRNEDSGRVFGELQDAISLEKRTGDKVHYLECFRGTNLRRTLIVAFARLMPCLFGLSLLSNASYFLQMVGMDDQHSLIVFALGIALGLVANASSVWISTLFGRRNLMLSTLSVTTVLWLGMGISGFWPSSPVVPWYTAATMMLIIISCGIGAWPSSYTVSGETSSLRLRAKTQSIGTLAADAANILYSFVLPYAYNKDAGNLGAKTGFIFFAICVLTTGVTWWVIPEMKGRSNVEIDHMFELRLPTRKFKGWSGVDDANEAMLEH